MRRFDVFNGDADGICALHQLRLAEPAEAELVTGVKRDIELLKRVSAEPGDLVTALDISLDRNREALLTLLELGVRVRYFDHHSAHDIPGHPGLEALIDQSPDTCTSALVDRYLGGRFRVWAVVAAFGDNVAGCAGRLAASLDLTTVQLAALCKLGETLNYNAYGETEADLLAPPAELYRLVHSHADPFTLIRDEPLIAQLDGRRREDLAAAKIVRPQSVADRSDVYLLPDEQWSRRVSGTFAHCLANRDAERAHAVLTPNARGGYSVSIRCPPNANTSAVDLCRKYASGGGRRQSAGIDHLEAGQLAQFLAEFEATFRR